MDSSLSPRSLATMSIIIVLILASNIASLGSVMAQNQLSISIQISNDSEYTVVTGAVTDFDHNPVEGAAVSVQAVDASGKPVHFELVYSDMNGAFIDRFKTPEGVSGDGNIYISASKPGYENGNAQSAFTVVPEFSTVFAAVIAAVSVTFLMLRRRKD